MFSNAKSFITLGALVVAAIVAGGCSSADSAPETSEAPSSSTANASTPESSDEATKTESTVQSEQGDTDIDSIVVGFIPSSFYSYLWQAGDAGYYTKNNLSVELTPMAGGAAIIPALQAGTVQFGISDAMGAILARKQGIDVQYLTFNASVDKEHSTHSVITSDDSIKSAADLKGKTIALNSTFNTDWIMMRKWLRAGGVDPAAVTFIEMPFPDQLAALRAGTIDAAGMLEPFVTMALNDGMSEVGRYFTDVQSPVAVSGVLMMRDYAEQNPDIAEHLYDSIASAVKDFNTDPELARTVTGKHTELAPELVSTIGFPVWSNDLTEADMKFWIDAATEEGLIDSAVDVSGLIWQR